jgi:aryl-alcohol dehydrogenase-like predicted oxidoreductase
MHTRPIGSLAVSVVGVGCNNFGRSVDEAGTARVVRAALDAGVTLFDTADIYGGTQSEVLLGRALGERRREAVVATKFGMRVDDARRGAHPDYVRRACEDSLRRLGTDVIDLYQLHEPDPSVPIADTLGALDRLVTEGKVREVGCSNFSVAQLREAAAVRTRAHFVSVQNEYSLLQRAPEHDGVLAECARAGLAFLPYFPLADGLLTGKYRRGRPLPEGARLSAGTGRAAERLADANLARVERLAAVAEARGHSLLELAVAWLLARPAVASVIAGATRPEQVVANAAAAAWQLGPDDLAAVDAAHAGPVEASASPA